MKYEIGEHVVKPGNGVCRVEDVLYMDVPGADKKQLYYLFVPLTDQNQKIYVPTNTADANFRKAMSEQEAWDFIAKIPQIGEIWIDDEKMRDHRYKEAVQGCVPEELAAIIKMTYLRKKKRSEQGKKGTVSDERYFRLAESYLYSELGFALHKDKTEICCLISDSVKGKKQPHGGEA